MNLKTKTIVFSALFAGSLAAQAMPAHADDYWHWMEHEHRWERRASVRSDERDLNEARRQLKYDRDHHASKRRIAEDEARVRDIERELHADRRG